MKIVIGVDAGGTGTRAVAMCDGRVVRRGLAGPGNPASSGPARTAEHIKRAVNQVVGPDDTVLGLAAGVAGISALDEAMCRASLEDLRCPVRFYADAVTAFAAGTDAADGTVLIAGTGAVAATIRGYALGEVADGLGWLVGDEGSGVWLGLAAVRRVARTWNGSPLVDLVAKKAGVGTVDDLVNWANRGPLEDFAALAPGVCALAVEGDKDAQRLVQEAASLLVSTVESLPAVDGPLVIAGGLLGSPTAVQQAVLERLAKRDVRVGEDPAVGAARLAGWSPMVEETTPG
jgi:N-acetylglucosamine kinase-like BadF-type ATPase